ncbi:hypothetical protein [Convivina intestini]|uniref:hypothetical protein n=1 Tax=Convivina intestini TaxID=1505726 RepID=UPI0020105C46|nr:hypothetical protein [Convivina intestini]CAH1853773.1 hypothetical protein R078131_00834 [Convivina intestini]
MNKEFLKCVLNGFTTGMFEAILIIIMGLTTACVVFGLLDLLFFLFHLMRCLA